LAACQRRTPSSLAAVIGLSNNDVISLYVPYVACVALDVSLYSRACVIGLAVVRSLLSQLQPSVTTALCAAQLSPSNKLVSPAGILDDGQKTSRPNERPTLNAGKSSVDRACVQRDDIRWPMRPRDAGASPQSLHAPLHCFALPENLH